MALFVRPPLQRLLNGPARRGPSERNRAFPKDEHGHAFIYLELVDDVPVNSFS
jgi:hypothetical protein